MSSAAARGTSVPASCALPTTTGAPQGTVYRLWVSACPEVEGRVFAERRRRPGARPPGLQVRDEPAPGASASRKPLTPSISSSRGEGLSRTSVRVSTERALPSWNMMGQSAVELWMSGFGWYRICWGTEGRNEAKDLNRDHSDQLSDGSQKQGSDRDSTSATDTGLVGPPAKRFRSLRLAKCGCYEATCFPSFAPLKSLQENRHVDEVRTHREAHAAEFGYDLAAICRDLRQQQADSNRKFVTLPARRVQPVNSGGRVVAGAARQDDS